MCNRLLAVAPKLIGKRNKEIDGDVQDNIHNEREKIEILTL